MRRVSLAKERGSRWRRTPIHGHLVVVSHHHGVLVVHLLDIEIVGRASVLNRLWFRAGGHTERAQIRIWRARSPAPIRNVKLWRNGSLSRHGRTGLAGMAVHVELVVPLMVVHLGAPRWRWHLGVGCDRRRILLAYQFGCLLQWRRGSCGYGSHKVRIALRSDVERRNLQGNGW